MDRMGVIDAEHFISLIKRDDFDYTAWQREYFDKMDPGEFGIRHSLMQKVIPIQEKRIFCNRERRAVNQLIGLLPFSYKMK